MKTICGIDCTGCGFSSTCKGCAATGGKPFGGECVLANWCKKEDHTLDEYKNRLIASFNSLHIPGMEEVTELNALKGSFINIAYPMPGGHSVKLWDDNRIYLGNQLHKKGSNRCYGIAADETYLLVAEYGDSGSVPEIVVFQRWN